MNRYLMGGIVVVSLLLVGLIGSGLNVAPQWADRETADAVPVAHTPADTSAAQSEAPTALFLPEVDAQLSALEARTGSTLGVAAWHVESSSRYEWRADETFAMASVYKIAIATHVLQLVDRGILTLDSVLPVRVTDFCPGSGLLVYSLQYGDTQASVRRLFHLMMAESDNTATDVLLGAVGGPYAVQEALAEWGISGLRVDRTVAGMFAGCTARPLPLAHQRSLQGMTSRYLYNFTPQELSAAATRMRTDSLDSAQPQALLQLLQHIQQGDLLAASSKEFLLEVMAKCKTGDLRIRKAMPQGATIFHKTGTFFGTCNDAAIVQLPGGRGHLLLVVMMNGPAHSKGLLERTVSDAAAAVYSHLPLDVAAEKFGG